MPVTYTPVPEPLRAPDGIGFYRWSSPSISYNATTSELHVGMSARSREIKIATFNLATRAVETNRVLDEYDTSDDHNIPAFLIEDGQEPLVACHLHDAGPTVRTRTGPLKGSVRSLNAVVPITNASAANVSYSQIHKRTTTSFTNGRLLMFRAASAWWFSVSPDKGATWPVASKMHSNIYQVSRPNSTGSTIYFVTTDPTEYQPCVLRFFKISANTGVATNAFGTALTSSSNILTAPANVATALYANTNMDVVLTSDAGTSHRLYDVSRTGSSIAISRLTGTSATNSQYIVLRKQGSATTNTWAEETICDSGPVFGGGANSYFGGMSFDGPDALYLVRCVGTTWTLERWTRTGVGFGAGTWSMERVLHTVTGTPGLAGAGASGRWLARPMVPQGTEGMGIVACSELRSYSTANATDWVSDLIVPTPVGS